MSSEIGDTVFTNCAQEQSALRETLQNGTIKNVQQHGQSNEASGRKGRGKKWGCKKEVVDLRTLLTLCARAVAANGKRTHNELLKHIRQHSSLMAMGNPLQRLAHYFADGLEARMAGSGAQIYKDLVSKPASAAEVLKAYYLYLVVCRLRGYRFCSQTRQ